MNQRLVIFSILILVFLIWWQPINFSPVRVTIPEGTSAKEIAEYLSSYHIVRDVKEFLFWLKISGKEKYLKSGAYELPRFRNPIYVIDKLAHGGRSDIIVVIPEGLTICETAEVLVLKGLVDKKRFITLCNDRIFIQKLGLSAASLEGYLFPDTYSFSDSQTDSQIITTFIKNFKEHMRGLKIDNPDSLCKILIIASLVEKEAKFEDERPIIAKIFINRLEANRPLESCATVFYALKNINRNKDFTKTKLTEHDLKVNSPYNTYLHTGLPPGPVCSPGESSIIAVKTPADVDYLYFVSRGNGRHHFSKTFKEHLAAKEKYNEK